MALATAMGVASSAGARVFYSKSEALELAFPDATRVELQSFVLTDAQREAVEQRAKAPLASAIIGFHTGWRDDELLGYARIDIHTVRTLPEALMVVLTPEGRVRSVRVLAFHEPQDYLPTGGWFEQFHGRGLDDDLRLRHGIHAVAGATLSSRAVTRAVRLTVALHEELLRPPTSEE